MCYGDALVYKCINCGILTRSQECSQLTTTLMVMDCAYRNRVSLFPLALGSSQGTGTINAAADNRGNVVLNQIVKDEPPQQFLEPIHIIIEASDSIFTGVNLEDMSISLRKMDVVICC
jgi:hypothetical protein